MDPEQTQGTGRNALDLLLEQLAQGWAQGLSFLGELLRPWNAYQVLIVGAVFLAAWALKALLGPRIRAWMASREGWPTWRMRILVVVNQRLRMIFFVMLVWLTVWIMREVTWPSRSYLITIVAELATAWLFVIFATRLIRSVLIRTVVRYGAWAYVTLAILNLRDEASVLLDGIGFNLGEMRVSLLVLLQAAVVLALLIAGARLITRTTAARIERNEDISPSMRVLVVKFMQVALYGLAIVIGLRSVGVDLTGLAVLSGAIGVGLGFGLQKVVSNLVSGVIILLDKSIKPGDVISLGDTFGWIQTLGARYASVVTRDGKEYLIPNEDLITNQVVNWSHSDEFVRLDIHFGASYGDDPHLVRRIAIEAARGVDRVLTSKAPVCHITGFGDSSVDYILRFWISDPTGGLTNIRGNVFLALWDAFHAHGISIPFPQREVRMLDDGPKTSA
jgi:small-conductance mechanosensitive channel